MKYQKIKGKRHYVFETVREFETHFMEKRGVVPSVVHHWREANEGDWVLSDDNRIIQILKLSGIKHPQDTKNYKNNQGWLRTVVGTFLINKKTFLDTDFEKHKDRYRFNGKTNDEYLQNRKKRDGVSKQEREFVAALISGNKDPVEIVSEIYPKNKNPHKKLLELLTYRRIILMLSHNVDEVAKTLKINAEWYLKKLKHFVEDEDFEDSQRLKALDKIGDLLKIGEAEGGTWAEKRSQLNAVEDAKLIEEEESKGLIEAGDKE